MYNFHHIIYYATKMYCVCAAFMAAELLFILRKKIKQFRFHSEQSLHSTCKRQWKKTEPQQMFFNYSPSDNKTVCTRYHFFLLRMEVC